MNKEEILQLRQYPRHYLWNKLRKDWTDEDLANLMNPNEEHARKKRNTGSIQRVSVTIDAITKEFDSVKEASKETGIKAKTIYAAINLNGKKTKSGFEFKKL